MMRLLRKKLSSYIIDSCDTLLKKYPDAGAGVFVVGDFNTLQTNCFNSHLNLVQIVNTSTRGKNILDKIRYLQIAAGFIHLLSFCRQLINRIIIVFVLNQNVTVIITQQQQGLLLDSVCHQMPWILLHLQLITYVGKICTVCHG